MTFQRAPRMTQSFNPRRPCGRRRAAAGHTTSKTTFQSAPPVWAATVQRWLSLGYPVVSIRAARVGGDLIGPLRILLRFGFNPRRPCGRRRHRLEYNMHHTKFQSAPPVWAATDRMLSRGRGCQVSIRAARVGGDPLTLWVKELDRVSIRAARVGGDPKRSRRPGSMRSFNPRRPCGRRRRHHQGKMWTVCFNPRRPCGRRRCLFRF